MIPTSPSEDRPDPCAPYGDTVPYTDEVAALIERAGGKTAAARSLGIEPDSVRRWARQGHIPSRHVDELLHAPGAADTAEIVTAAMRGVLTSLQALQRARALLEQHTSSREALDEWDRLTADVAGHTDTLKAAYQGLL